MSAVEALLAAYAEHVAEDDVHRAARAELDQQAALDAATVVALEKVKAEGVDLGQSDTTRLNWLEMVIWSEKVGTGVAVFPTVSLTGIRHVVLQDLGDEDGSNLGDELTATQKDLRAAIDAAMKEKA